MGAVSRVRALWRAVRDQSDSREAAVVTWSVDHTVPEWSQLYPSSIREDEPILAEHAEILERRARSLGWRSLVPPETAAAAKAGKQARDGFDRLAERRARLARRLERGRTWTRELAGGATVRQIAEREGVTGPWIRFEVLFARLDAEITAELLRPGSWSAALSNEALREVARRKTPEAQARLFWPLVEQVQRKVGVDKPSDVEICASA